MKLTKIEEKALLVINKPDQFLCVPKEPEKQYFVGFFFQSKEYNDYYTYDNNGMIATTEDLSEIYLISKE